MKKNKKRLPKINPTIQLFAAWSLFISAAFISTRGGVAEWEINLFKSVYGLPGFLHPFFFVITQFGSILMLGFLLVLYLLRKHYHIVIRLIMTGTLAYLVSGFAKDIWGRVRPADILLDVVNLDY